MLDDPVQSVEVRGPDGFESAFDAAAKERVGAILLVEDLLSRGASNADCGPRRHDPAAGEGWIQGVRGGRGLMADGASRPDLHRCAAVCVDNRLKFFRFSEREVLPTLEDARRGKEAA